MSESYDFCNYLDHYIGKEKSLPDVFHSLRYTYCKIYFDDSFRNKDLENLCGKFKYLYDLVFGPFNKYTMNEKNGEYLNYWLNKELNNKGISNISAKWFYQKIMNNDSFFDNEQHLEDKIHNIKVEDLEKMNILYEMYDIYNNIKTTYNDEENCKLYSDECVKKFNDAIEKYSDDKNDEFYKALKSFKEKYDQSIEDNIFGGCNKEDLSKLPPLGEETELKAIIKGPAADTSEQETLQEEKKDQDFGARNNLEQEEMKESKHPIQQPFSVTGENNNDNNISIFTIFGIILSISVFSTITYKFTPLGSWINR
ncbi:PIR protein [Plasmodium vivax]|nr:PIR protein [Plasmodium vivax]